MWLKWWLLVYCWVAIEGKANTKGKIQGSFTAFRMTTETELGHARRTRTTVNTKDRAKTGVKEKYSI